MSDLLQSGAIPYRRRGDTWEFLLVTSKGGKWIFPKGIVERNMSPEETAANESKEEAGIRGRVMPNPVGSYMRNKWRHACEVVLFLMHYEEDIEPWEEKNIRERCWCTFEEATSRLKKEDLQHILRQANERLETESRKTTSSRS